MGKRSSFERVDKDFYRTPPEVLEYLKPFLPDGLKYIEPCAGDGAIVDNLAGCVFASDIKQYRKQFAECDALSLTDSDLPNVAQYIITNPPWSRDALHSMILHFKDLLPTWLLFDADWMHTKQSSEYIKCCDLIISVGRVKWFPETKMVGKDNVCWYRFQKDRQYSTYFIGR